LPAECGVTLHVHVVCLDTASKTIAAAMSMRGPHVYSPAGDLLIGGVCTDSYAALVSY
jgi:hypothetical protein